MGIEQLTVDYVEHSGSDISVVNAARVSFDKKSEALGHTGIGDGPMVPVVHDSDKNLIKYLADNKHYSPFNHTFVTFRCSAPLFIMGQLKKHEYMPWNEISRRYIDSKPEFYMPDTWRGKSEDKKQGSSNESVDTLYWSDLDTELSIEGHPVWHEETECGVSEYTQYMYEDTLQLYTRMIDNGVCPEQARMVLPQSTMSSWIWSGTVKAVAKMCNLRCTSDTQYESRVIANKISEHMHTLFPVSWSALMGTNHPRIRPMTDEERQRAKDKVA